MTVDIDISNLQDWIFTVRATATSDHHFQWKVEGNNQDSSLLVYHQDAAVALKEAISQAVTKDLKELASKTNNERSKSLREKIRIAKIKESL